MLILGKLTGKRTVMSIRSQVRDLPSDKYAYWYRKLALRFFDTVVCQSEHAASELVKRFGYPREKIEIIANWVDAEKYTPSDRSQNNVETKFLFMGWLEKFKGVQHIIEAADQLRQSGHKFKVDIYGGGSELESLTDLCSQLDVGQYVEFCGWVSGAGKLDALATANIAILPSYNEGMPNFLLEAMSCGLAVVATPVGGVPSLIQSSEQGILVEPKSSAELANAMSTLIKDPELVKQMGNFNRGFVEENHHVKNVWTKMARALNLETVQ